MKSTLLFENHGLGCFLVVMDKGDEAHEQIPGPFPDCANGGSSPMPDVEPANH